MPASPHHIACARARQCGRHTRKVRQSGARARTLSRVSSVRASGDILVEVCVESVAGADLATVGGAGRLELCSALDLGGLTPSIGLCEAVSARTTVPVFAMLRPRAGDFLYDAGEVDVMVRDLDRLKAAGADGFVVGALTADGQIDRRRMREFVDAADGLPVTCNRAFDLCRDADEAIDALCELGVARVLTSGQATSAADGRLVIRAAVRRAAGRIEVMAGGGVRADNVVRLLEVTGVREVHLSAAGLRASRMRFRRDVPMGGPGSRDEYSLRTTEESQIARVIAAVADL